MITLMVDNSRLKERLKALRARGSDMSPAFAEIGEMLLSSIEQNFQDGGRYGTPGTVEGGSNTWQDLAPATVRQRAKTGRGPRPILQVSGQLAASIHSEPSAKGVTVGTNLAYAAIHNFGGRAGRGRKVEIPARPFLVAQNQDVDDAIDTIEHHLTKGES